MGITLRKTSLLSILLLLVISGTAQQASKPAQQPPQEAGPFRQSDLVELVKLDSTIKLG